MSIKATLDLTALDKAFKRINVKAADYRAPYELIGKEILKENYRTFIVHGPGWAPNSKGDNSNVKTGQLKDSYTIRGAKGNVFRVTRKELEVGSSLDYARDQVGTTFSLKLGKTASKAGVKKATPPLASTRVVTKEPSVNLRDKIGKILSVYYSVST